MGVITVGEAIDLVERGYREASEFPLINALRRRVHSRNNVRVSNFPGGVDGLGVIGSLTRAESVRHHAEHQDYPHREHPVHLLWDSVTAQLQAILIGEITDRRIGYSSLMLLRTAATSGVGFRHLARKNARVAGVYGSGGQALHKVLALQHERQIEKVPGLQPRPTGVRLNFLDEAHDVDSSGFRAIAPFWTQKEINVMQHQNTVLHQLLQQVPWGLFDALVERHQADKHVPRLNTRAAFLAMLYGQLSGATSLREIVTGLESCRTRLYHVGAKPA